MADIEIQHLLPGIGPNAQPEKFIIKNAPDPVSVDGSVKVENASGQPFAATVDGPLGQPIRANVDATIYGGTPLQATVHGGAPLQAVVSGLGGGAITAGIDARWAGGPPIQLQLDAITIAPLTVRFQPGIKVRFLLFGFLPLWSMEVTGNAVLGP